MHATNGLFKGKLSSQAFIFLSISRGCIKSAKILINNGADVNMQAIHGYCPLHAASQVK
jgi:hypothetical protein